jgi:hypothetical protein
MSSSQGGTMQSGDLQLLLREFFVHGVSTGKKNLIQDLAITITTCASLSHFRAILPFNPKVCHQIKSGVGSMMADAKSGKRDDIPTNLTDGYFGTKNLAAALKRKAPPSVGSESAVAINTGTLTASNVSTNSRNAEPPPKRIKRSESSKKVQRESTKGVINYHLSTSGVIPAVIDVDNVGSGSLKALQHFFAKQNLSWEIFYVLKDDVVVEAKIDEDHLIRVAVDQDDDAVVLEVAFDKQAIVISKDMFRPYIDVKFTKKWMDEHRLSWSGNKNFIVVCIPTVN